MIDLTRITRVHLALLAAVVVLAIITRWADPKSILLGGGVMGLNVWLLKFITQVLISGAGDPEKSGRTGLAVAAFVLHFGIFIGLAAAMFWRLPIDAMGFATGVTMLLVACVIEAIRVDRMVTEPRP